jgi:hypothetical protein
MVIEGALPASSVDRVPEEIDPAVTRATTVPEEMRDSPAPAEPPARAAAPAAAAPGAPAAPRAPAAPLGEFQPPERQRPQRGLASRSWVPVALSFGTVLATAVLLVLYFALRATP